MKNKKWISLATAVVLAVTALISGEIHGAEASIYAYQEGATDPAVNFAQLTQRAGNFLVAREEMSDFKWEDLKGKKVLGGRKGGMHISMLNYETIVILCNWVDGLNSAKNLVSTCT